jgi:16S rRNA (guanine527-N7)-methyltransferase
VKHISTQLSEDQILKLQRALSSLKIELSARMLEQFQIYLSQILDWNKRIHLVSKSDAQPERLLRHFVDSLTIFEAIQIPQKANLLDLGAGAGFPSIPIKIVRDDVNLTLVESTRKKSLFLQKLVKDMELGNVMVINQRAEELMNSSDYKEKFNIVTAKALGKLKDTIELTKFFLKSKGLLVAYKGEKVEEEIKEIKGKDFLINKRALIEIPDFDLKRTLVVLEKIE